MKPSDRALLLAVALVSGACSLWFLVDRGVKSVVSSASHELPQSSERNPSDSGLAVVKDIVDAKGDSVQADDEVSPLAVELNSPQFTPQHDVDVLHTLLRQYLRRLGHREGLPIGNDSDLAKVLRGDNPMKYAALPPNHPAISREARLVDRWGNPYFVHPVAENSFEVRSAGPDGRLFTSDDILADPTGGTTQ